MVSVCSGCHHKIPHTEWLKHRNGFSRCPRGWKSKIKVLEILISGENCLPVLQMVTFWLCPYMVERESSGVFSSSYKDVSPGELDSHPYDFIEP